MENRSNESYGKGRGMPPSGDFDPMTESYNDPVFNSYLVGPGANMKRSMHVESRRREENANFRLFVGSISQCLTEEGLRNIFKTCGEPVRVVIGKKNGVKCNWGFVDYKTMSEAVRAINTLHKNEPYYLTVQFAQGEEEKAEKKKLQGMANFHTQDIRPLKPSGSGCGRGLTPPMKGVPPKTVRNTCVLSPTYSDSESPEIGYSRERFQHYKKDPLIDCTSAVFDNLTMQISGNQRQISLGRGSYLFDDKADDMRAFSHRFYRPKLEEKVDGFVRKEVHYTNKSNGTYVYNDEPANFPNRLCENCKEPTQLACSSCRSWFCSYPCLTSDQELHKDNCSAVNEIKKSLKNDLNEEENSNTSSSFKSNELLNSVKPPDSKVTNKYTCANQRDGNKQTSKGFRNINRSKNICVREDKTELQPNENKANNKTLNPPIPADKFTKVEITLVVQPNVYWVQDVANVGKQLEIIEKLDEHCNKSSHKCNPIQGSLCAAIYFGKWYRAKILNVEPELKVHFVDFGNEQTCNKDLLRELPHDLLNLPNLAFKIRLANGSVSLTDGAQIKIKPVSKEDSDTWFVQMEGDNHPVKDTISLIPFESFVKVTIMFAISENNYWVQTADDLKTCIKMTEFLANSSSIKVRPQLGEIYISEYTGVWCRAKVINQNPLKVFYIDYGNEETVLERNLCILPAAYKEVPPLAFHIKLAEGTPSKYLGLELFSSLCVKAVDKLNDGTFIVHVEGESYSSIISTPVPKKVSKALPYGERSSDGVNHVLFCAENGREVQFKVERVVSDDHLIGTLILTSPTVQSGYLSNREISQRLSSMNTFEYKPNVMDSVCVENSGLKVRGYVMSIWRNQYSVALVDYGKVIITSHLAQLPIEFQTFPEAAVRILLETPILQGTKLEGEIVTCKFKSYENGPLKVVIDSLGDADIIQWKPLIEEAGLPSVDVRSGDKVILTSYKSPRALYVQPLNDEDQEMLATVLQDLATHCNKVPPLDRNPFTGEFIACKFSVDCNYYRAQVSKRISNKYEVTFVDYGNSDIVPVTSMKTLPEVLKRIPCCTVKVGLKDVPTTGFSPTAMTLLNDLSAREHELYINYKNDDLGAATLISKDGMNLNDTLRKMATPVWKKALQEGRDPSDGHVYMISDLKYVQWHAKSRISLMILGERSHNEKLATNTTFEYLTHISSTLSEQINEYAEATSNDNVSYNPRLSELCIAKYSEDEKWYRAVCTKTLTTSSEIVFVDYGNTGEVTYSCIRRMPPDFISSPAILKCCKIYGIPNKVSEKVAMELGKVLVDGSLHQAVVVEDSLDSYALIWIPSLDSLLMKLGLPKVEPPFIL